MSSMQALGGASQLAGVPHGQDPRNPLYMTDEFMMYCFKVLPCEKTYRHDWWACPFVHPGESAKRRDPRKYRYTAVACPNAKQGGHCPRGDKCPGTHSVFEYWLHPSRFRTQFCDRGIHCNQPFCFFAHTVEQLRMPAPNDYSEGTQSSGASEGNRSRSGSYESISPRELQNRMFTGSPPSPVAADRGMLMEPCTAMPGWDQHVQVPQRVQRHSMSDFPQGPALFDGGSPRLHRRFSGGRPRQDGSNFNMFQNVAAVQPDLGRQHTGGHLRSLSLVQDIGLIQDLLQKMSAGPVHPPPPQVMPPQPIGMPYNWPAGIVDLGSPNSPLMGHDPTKVDPHQMGKATQDIAVEGVLSHLGLDLVSQPLV